MRTVVLASSSPRRRDILQLTRVPFVVDPSDVDEILDPCRDPHDLARDLSLQKAHSVSGRHPDSLVVAADTFIVYGGTLLGKPHTDAEARTMLGMLSGRVHSVITGYCVLDASTGEHLCGSAETKVWIRRLTAHEIDTYVRSGEPLDKAGGYAIQGLGALIVEKIEGDFYNVVGLPLNELVRALGKFGVRVW